MTLRELEAVRPQLAARALVSQSEDAWRDLEGVDHEIARRKRQCEADARLVDFHQRQYGSQPEDALLLEDVDEPGWWDDLTPKEA